MDVSEPGVALPPSTPATTAIVPWLLVAVSTAIAFVSHQLAGPPGDHPIALLAIGCAIAFVVGATRKMSPIVAGLASMSGFPVEATIDLCLHGGHDLLPVEFAFYAAYAAIGVLAAVLGRATTRVLASILQA